MRYILLVILFLTTNLCAYPITKGGRALATYLDSLDVEHKWLPGHHVDWQTGEPDQVTGGVTRSHCSAFAAAATLRLGVYLLRPPEHSEFLLANAQYNWLLKKSKPSMWLAISDSYEAQRLANQGCMVIAAYKNPNPKRSGHIAIVRPSDKPDAVIYKEGPDITQAGLENHQRTSLLEGFRHHTKRAQDPIFIYYAHNTQWCANA